MTALWIIGGIVLLIVLLMMISVTVYVKIDETVRIKVGALGIRFTVFPASRKKEKPPKTKKHQDGPDKCTANPNGMISNGSTSTANPG